jgi:hypothetical protein
MLNAFSTMYLKKSVSLSYIHSDPFIHTFITLHKVPSFYNYRETMKLTEKHIEHNMCFSLGYKVLSKHFSLRYIKSYADVHARLQVKCPLLRPVLTTLEIIGHLIVQFSDIEFRENPCMGPWDVTSLQTDKTIFSVPKSARMRRCLKTDNIKFFKQICHLRKFCVFTCTQHRHVPLTYIHRLYSKQQNVSMWNECIHIASVQWRVLVTTVIKFVFHKIQEISLPTEWLQYFQNVSAP